MTGCGFSRYALPGVHLAEHIQLLIGFSAHIFFLPAWVVETREFFGTGSVFSRMLPCKVAGDRRELILDIRCQ